MGKGLILTKVCKIFRICKRISKSFVLSVICKIMAINYFANHYLHHETETIFFETAISPFKQANLSFNKIKDLNFNHARFFHIGRLYHVLEYKNLNILKTKKRKYLVACHSSLQEFDKFLDSFL